MTSLPSLTSPLRDKGRRLIRPGLIIAVTAALGLLCCGGAVSAIIFGDLATNNSALTNAMNCGSTKTISITGQFPRIGPYSVIGRQCHIGEDAVVAGAIVWPHTTVDAGAKLGAVIAGRHCQFGRNVEVVSPGVFGDRSIVTDYSRV